MGKSKDTDQFSYIVVIDAGSKGSRAHLYRTKDIDTPKIDARKEKSSNDKHSEQLENDDSDESEDEDTKDKTSKSFNYPKLKLIKRKKVKPGIASFLHSTKKLDDHYMGELLESITKHIPKNQIHRTPVFLHATGGMRLLKPEQQSTILNHICEYIKDKSDLFLPDCDTHINAITGEIEGIYSWVGLNYKYGVFDPSKKTETFGMLDMGGVSSQVAFEPDDSHNSTDILFKVELDFTTKETDSLKYQVFSESFLSGMSQAHHKYEEKLLNKSETIDACLPKGFVKTIDNDEGYKVDVEGGGDFFKCLESLDEVLQDVSVNKYCNQTDSTSSSSCLLSDELPKMDFNQKKFIGINEYYSNMKKFVNYKEFYDKTKGVCLSSYTDLLENKEFKTDPEKSSERCFKSSWIISVLHQGVGFVRYGIDDVNPENQIDTTNDENFETLEDYSCTLGRAVLYSYYETALRLNGNTSIPNVGYYEPSSTVFVHGGEAPGIQPRPEYVSWSDFDNGKYKGKGKSVNDDNDNDDDDDKNDNDWDDVLEEHRLWGSLLFLLIILLIAYLLLGRTKRQSIKDAVKRVFKNKFRSHRYEPVVIDRADIELGEIDGLENETQRGKRDDSFDLSS